MLDGVLADRGNKRNIMVVLDFMTAAITAGCYFLIGSISIIPLLIVVLMLLYRISGIYQSTVRASIPRLVSKDHILLASTIVNQIGAVANFMGPMFEGIACIMTLIMCAQPVGQFIYGILFKQLVNLSIPIFGAKLISLGIAIYAKKYL